MYTKEGKDENYAAARAYAIYADINQEKGQGPKKPPEPPKIDHESIRKAAEKVTGVKSRKRKSTKKKRQ